MGLLSMFIFWSLSAEGRLERRKIEGDTRHQVFLPHACVHMCTHIRGNMYVLIPYIRK